jgi:hypothetical protein
MPVRAKGPTKRPVDVLRHERAERRGVGSRSAELSSGQFRFRTRGLCVGGKLETHPTACLPGWVLELYRIKRSHV